MHNIYWTSGNKEGREKEREHSETVKELIGVQKCVVDVPTVSFNVKVRDWVVDPNADATHMLKVTKKKKSGNMNIVSAKVEMKPDVVPEVDVWAERLQAHVEPEVVRIERAKLVKKIKEDTQRNREVVAEVQDHVDTIKIML